MRLVIYGDCIPSGPVSIAENKRFPGLIVAEIDDLTVDILPNSGMTTAEARDGLAEVLEKKPDTVVLVWGLNDALPRGLSRPMRSRIIRAMYRLGMNENTRLFWRTYFLNPLEFAMQLVRKPKFYCTAAQTRENFTYIIDTLKSEGIKRIIVLSVPPNLNYRFRKANRYIETYNGKIEAVCKAKSVDYIDIYKEFVSAGIKKALFSDRFHYGELGHRIAANEIKSKLKG